MLCFIYGSVVIFFFLIIYSVSIIIYKRRSGAQYEFLTKMIEDGVAVIVTDRDKFRHTYAKHKGDEVRRERELELEAERREAEKDDIF